MSRELINNLVSTGKITWPQLKTALQVGLITRESGIRWLSEAADITMSQAKECFCDFPYHNSDGLNLISDEVMSIAVMLYKYEPDIGIEYLMGRCGHLYWDTARYLIRCYTD